MRKYLVAIGAVVVALAASPVLAGDAAVADLVEDGVRYSGVEVTVVGEFVGDYGHRRDGNTWAQLNGDSYAFSPVADGGQLEGPNIGVGVRMPTPLAVSLDAPGRYRTVGPRVRITGTWKHHDPDRQGESYLDVVSVEVLEPGRILHESPEASSYIIGLILLAGTAVTFRRYAKRRDAVT